MGLFDRLFGRKKKEETAETPAVEESQVDALPQADLETEAVQEEISLADSVAEDEHPAEGQTAIEIEDAVLETDDTESAAEAEAPADAQESDAVESATAAPTAQPTSDHEAIADEVFSTQQGETSDQETVPTDTEVDELAKEQATEVSDQLEALDSAEETAESPLAEDTVTEAEIATDPSADALGASVEEESAEAPVDEGTEGSETIAELSSEESEARPNPLTPQETEQEKYDRSLKKTRKGFGARLNAFFANFRTVDEDFFEELEELLILSDVGVSVATNLVEDLRYEAKLENAKKPDALRRLIIEKLVDIYEKDGQFNEALNIQPDGVTVMLFVGVNGVGKTTSIGKLAYQYKQEGKKVMLVAADTFRAGAVAQLEEWARRVDVPIVTGPEKSDPASVVYDGMERAVAEGVDILLIDTAGRLQNKDNLMAELEKIGRIIKRVIPEAPHETLLALDASTGQNALVQAKEFSKITPVTGIVLTKIDGTARGGIVLAIREELDIPVKLIGFGEKIDDIGAFHSEEFMRGLLDGLI